MTVGYPGNPLFTARKVELRRGECAALIGPNGSGKTTFLKVLLGQLTPLEGRGPPGRQPEGRLLCPGPRRPKRRTQRAGRTDAPQGNAARRRRAAILARYLFPGDDIFKPVQALSGGERARLALAILALDGANLLLLDEPTNHLDIPAREALQEVLENFPGTILLVSHDRFLIDQLATQIWEIRDDRLEVFHGNYREYVLRKADRASSAPASRLILQSETIGAR